jgi:hypothetical protein
MSRVQNYLFRVVKREDLRAAYIRHSQLFYSKSRSDLALLGESSAHEINLNFKIHCLWPWDQNRSQACIPPSVRGLKNIRYAPQYFPRTREAQSFFKQFLLIPPRHGYVDRLRYQADTASLRQLQVGPPPHILANVDPKHCRRKKTKCTGDRPICSHCRRNRLACIYEPYSVTLAENSTVTDPAISLTSNANNLNNVGFKTPALWFGLY